MEEGARAVILSDSGTTLRGVCQTINFITDQGAHAIVDPHNFGR